MRQASRSYRLTTYMESCSARWSSQLVNSHWLWSPGDAAAGRHLTHLAKTSSSVHARWLSQVQTVTTWISLNNSFQHYQVICPPYHSCYWRVSCTILYVSLVVILNKGVFPTFYLQDPKYSIEKSKIVHECFRVYIITILFHTYYTKRCLLHLSDIFKNGNCTLLPGKWFLHHSTCISQILLNVL